MTIICHERWYQRGEPFLGESFTVKKTIKRHAKICDILARAAKRETREGNSDLVPAFHQLHERIRQCHPERRCGSSACPKCAHAFQRAKVASQEAAILKLAAQRAGKQLVMVTIVPKSMAYLPGQFLQIDLLKANRWLKDALARVGLRRVVIGSIDLGWESRNGAKYLQLHWHLAMWTHNVDALRQKLKPISPKGPKGKRPIHVAAVNDLNVLAYINKLIKLPKLLRSAKKQLPELLLLLDRTDSFDFLFSTRLRLCAQSGGIALRKVRGTQGGGSTEKS